MTFVILSLLALAAVLSEARAAASSQAGPPARLPGHAVLLPGFKGASETLSRNHELRRLLSSPALPEGFLTDFAVSLGFSSNQVAVSSGAEGFIPAPPPPSSSPGSGFKIPGSKPWYNPF